MEQSNISRRGLLGHFAGIGTAGILLANCAPQGAEASSIEAVITTHRAVSQHLGDIATELDEAEYAFEADYKVNPIRTRMSTGGYTDPYHGNPIDEINAAYARERSLFCNPRLEWLCPEAHRLTLARLEAMEAEDLAKVPDIFRRWDERQARFGLPRLAQRQAEAVERASEALAAFLAFIPETVEEYRLKAGYVAELNTNGEVESKTLIQAMAASSSGGRA